MRRPQEIEQPADWEALWDSLDEAHDEVDAEQRSLRWRVQEELAQRAFGGLEGVDVIEIGAGRSTNALVYAMRGARAAALDTSATALELTRKRFAQRGLPVETVQADAFALPDELRGRFDIAISFGLCEHFLGRRRRDIIGAHLELVRPGGLAIVNVPNRYSPFYRAWMGYAKRRGTWTLGTEVPFTARELRDLAIMAGGIPLAPIRVGGLGTIVATGINPLLARLIHRQLPIPQNRVPGLDLVAYDLMQPIIRPGWAVGPTPERRP
jgi:2-polyprenyl-3-methyl-5-hydroxy-6-metoxy-1,4-benzoquinol methylase